MTRDLQRWSVLGNRRTVKPTLLPHSVRRPFLTPDAVPDVSRLNLPGGDPRLSGLTAIPTCWREPEQRRLISNGTALI
jgi:hypothetical protein